MTTFFCDKLNLLVCTFFILLNYHSINDITKLSADIKRIECNQLKFKAGYLKTIRTGGHGRKYYRHYKIGTVIGDDSLKEYFVDYELFMPILNYKIPSTTSEDVFPVWYIKNDTTAYPRVQKSFSDVVYLHKNYYHNRKKELYSMVLLSWALFVLFIGYRLKIYKKTL